MPKQTAQSGLFSRLGPQASKSLAAHRDEEPVMPTGGRLPAGIENGVARLTDIKIDNYKEGPNKGKPYFMASGIVVSPEVHEGVPVKGLRTQIGPEPLCDTPASGGRRKTFDDHFAWTLNQIKLLGLDTRGKSEAEVDAGIEALKQQGPHFRFRTWKGTATKEYPNPRTNEEWGGSVEWNGDGETAGGGVVDETGPSGAAPSAAQPPPDDAPVGDADPDGIDLDALGAIADGGDEEAAEARRQLQEAALAMGFSEAQINDDYATWEELASAMKGGAPPAEWSPREKEIYLYKPPGKDGKPVKKAVEVQVDRVDAKAKTVACHSQDNPRLKWGNVSWDVLEQVA